MAAARAPDAKRPGRSPVAQTSAATTQLHRNLKGNATSIGPAPISSDLEAIGPQRVRALSQITSTITEDVAVQIAELIGSCGWGRDEAVADVTAWWSVMLRDAIIDGIIPGLERAA